MTRHFSDLFSKWPIKKVDETMVEDDILNVEWDWFISIFTPNAS